MILLYIGLFFISLLVGAAPTFLLLLALSKITKSAWGLTTASSVLATCFSSLVILSVPPIWLNQDLDRQASSLVSDDHDELQLPLFADSIALRFAGSGASLPNATRCDGTCILALLSGKAKQVIVVPDNDLAKSISPQLWFAAFHLERLPVCPPIKLDAHNAGLMRTEIAHGNCLVETKATISDADVIVSIGQLDAGLDAITASLDLFADTVRADRIVVERKGEDGYGELYRSTVTVSHKFAPILVPVFYLGSYRSGLGFLRFEEVGNTTKIGYVTPDVYGFLQNELGLKFSSKQNVALSCVALSEWTRRHSTNPSCASFPQTDQTEAQH